MAFKLLESVLATCVVCKSQNYFKPKSRLSCMLESNHRFYCSKTQNDKPVLSSSSKVKEILNSSSPLRMSEKLDFNSDLWATSPYPEGTVFRDIESNKGIEDEEHRDLSSKSIIMFPGQGNQFVGMAKNLMLYPVALDMFNVANEILNCNLLKICLEGPEKILNDTKYCQPATFVCSLALIEKLKNEKPWAISNCWATCGYSLGELTALVFAGCVNFETGLKLVKHRAKAMALCCQKTPGGMLTIFTGPHGKLGQAFSDAIEHCTSKGIENPQCAVAAYLYPNCKVIAGNIEALEFIQNNARNYNILRHSKLPVSGAFHTLLMKDAAASFSEELSHFQFQKPIVKVFSNVTGKPYRNEKHIKKDLPKQIFKPVRWEQTLHNLFGHSNNKPYLYFFECGPGKSLTATVQKINSQAAQNCYSVQL